MEGTIEQRARMWAEGMSAKMIAYEQGVRVSSICSYMSEHRDMFPRRKGSTGRPRKYDHGKILALGKAGMAADAVAEEVGCDVTTARRVLRMGR